MMITIIRGGREGGGQRVMIKIIISQNYDNDGRPLSSWHHWILTESVNEWQLFQHSVLWSDDYIFGRVYHCSCWVSEWCRKQEAKKYLSCLRRTLLEDQNFKKWPCQITCPAVRHPWAKSCTKRVWWEIKIVLPQDLGLVSAPNEGSIAIFIFEPTWQLCNWAILPLNNY